MPGPASLSAWPAGFLFPYEVLAGEAGNVADTSDKINANVRQSFQTMRIFFSAGWCIYPLGYFFGYLQGKVRADSLGLVYNVADVINKIAFCLAIWHAAKKDTMEKESLLA